MTRPYSILIIVLFCPFLSFCQNLPDISGYSGKKIRTVIKDRYANTDTIFGRPMLRDSSENCTVVTYWESSIQINGVNILLHTRPTRLAVAYQNNPDYFFDSNKPVKLSPTLDILYRHSSERLVNKAMDQKIKLGMIPDLYEIKALDTLRFSDLFFSQSTPPKLHINDRWVDSAKLNYVSLIDTFFVKSIDNGIIKLGFRNKLTVDVKALSEAIKKDSNAETSASMFNSADYVEGTIIFDQKTSFIHSIEGTVTTFAGMEANGVVNRNWHTFRDSFSLENIVQ